MGRYLTGSLAIAALGIVALVIAAFAPQGEGSHALVVAGGSLASTGGFFAFFTILLGWDDKQ